MVAAFFERHSKEIRGGASGHLSHAEHRGTERREFLFAMDQGARDAAHAVTANVEPVHNGR